jgi:hypothetical protein
MKKIIWIFLMMLSLTCFGEQWNSVVMNDNNSVFFYDPDTVKRNGDFVQYWELSNYKEGITDGKVVVLSSKSLVEVDCRKNNYRTLRVIDYDKQSGQGKVLNVSLTEQSNWKSSLVGTVSSVMEERMCSSGMNKQ